MSAIPEWRRVREEIEKRIRAGQVRTDDDGRRWLPKLRELQAEHRTSYGTLRPVLLLLEETGWIIRRPGIGIEVIGPLPERSERSDE